jgi:hypothetical protein
LVTDGQPKPRVRPHRVWGAKLVTSVAEQVGAHMRADPDDEEVS